MEEPRKAWPLTPSSVSMVTRPSWLLPLNFPVCRPYVVAGMSSQPNSVRWTSVIFMVGGRLPQPNLRGHYAPISTARMDSMRISSVRRALYAENSGVVLTV